MPWVGCGRRWVTPIKRLVARKWDSCVSVCVRVCAERTSLEACRGKRQRQRQSRLSGRHKMAAAQGCALNSKGCAEIRTEALEPDTQQDREPRR